MKRFEAEWEIYRKVAVPKQAGEIQVLETKKAFYAGASSMVAALVGTADPTKATPDEADVKVLESIWKELDEFFKGIADEAQKALKKQKLIEMPKTEEDPVIITE